LLSAELSRFDPDFDRRSPVEKLLALGHRPGHALIPALPVSVAMLAALPEKSRLDNRILALLAQKDPVFLTRLLCLAAQPNVTCGERFATTADDAIEMIGASSALAAMMEIANLHPGPRHAASPELADKSHQSRLAEQQFILARCLAYALTTRRLSAYLELNAQAASQLLLAVLLDNLALWVAIHAECNEAETVRRDLAQSSNESYILRHSPLLADYNLLAIQLGKAWNAPSDILDILISGKNPLHSLLLSVERMVDAKRRKASQQQALLELIRGHAHWAARLRPGEIDLAVIR
jgi:hypothetical protein